MSQEQRTPEDALRIVRSWATQPIWIDPSALLAGVLASYGHKAYLKVYLEAVRALRSRLGFKSTRPAIHLKVWPGFELSIHEAEGEQTLISSFMSPLVIHPVPSEQVVTKGRK